MIRAEAGPDGHVMGVFLGWAEVNSKNSILRRTNVLEICSSQAML